VFYIYCRIQWQKWGPHCIILTYLKTNKRKRIPKGQSKMDNPEKPATQDETPHKNTICAGHHYTQSTTTNTSKTCALLQTTRGKDEPNVVFLRKSQRTSQHGTQNVKTHNRTTQKDE